MAILEDWGATTYYMDEEFDTGAIIECRHFKIDNKIVNKDLVQYTHKQLVELFKDTVDRILNREKLEKHEQGIGSYYSLRDLEKNKKIHSDESIEEIDRRIRAFWNPPYSGTQIEINGINYTVVNQDILEWIARNLKTDLC